MAGQRIPASKWRKSIAQRRSSGKSAQEYAEQQNFLLERLTYWVRRVERESQIPQLLSVEVQVPAVVPAHIELRSPSGWTMGIGTGTEPSWLATVLSGLR